MVSIPFFAGITIKTINFGVMDSRKVDKFKVKLTFDKILNYGYGLEHFAGNLTELRHSNFVG